MGKTKKVELHSMDIPEEKRRQFKNLFPEVFSEDKIDFEQLKRTLGEWVDADQERFDLNWPGKAKCMRIIQEPSVATLKPDRDESVEFDETENLFIEGDNLQVLKLLQRSYFGKVKMIYIDPPYNTGKEFIYPDKYGETLDTYLEYTGQKDSEGRKFATNTETSGRYHSRWLNMMYPRLYLARNLLREDGVIFIHIDENEFAQLRQLCNQIFGEENFVGNIAWKKTSGDNKPAFAYTHDNILIFTSKPKTFPRVPLNAKQKEQYKNPDNDPRGDWAQSDYRSKWNKNNRPNLYYGITNPNTREVIFPDSYADSLRVWGCDESTHLLNEQKGLVWWGSDGKGTEPKKKRFLSKHKGANTRSVWLDAGTNDDASKELKDLLNGDLFDNPKPVELLKRIAFSVTNDNDIALDFFAGSCTTAHAIMELNAENGGNRRCISVQLPEPCGKKSESFKAGYNTIADIGKERIRRAKKKIAEEKNQSDLTEGNKLDLGFKVFKLSRSNFKVWEGDRKKIQDIAKQLEMHIDHIDSDAQTEAILYELLLKTGYSLTAPIKKLTLSGKEVFSINNGKMLICLDKKITQEVIDAIADANPSEVICLDAGFEGNDQLKANAVQTFKIRAQKEESEIVFRTV